MGTQVVSAHTDVGDAGSSQFLMSLQQLASEMNTGSGQLVVPVGLINLAADVSSLPQDTKLLSTVLELALRARLLALADRLNMKVETAREQNHYPDFTFVDSLGNLYAVDVKSTYRERADRASSMTLGSFTGYFRDRLRSSGVTQPYGRYAAHLVFGVVYSRPSQAPDLDARYSTAELGSVPLPMLDLLFFAQPKYRIARDTPGSGNTKNIGAVQDLSALTGGAGPFASAGEHIFDLYWTNYLTREMARSIGMAEPPFRNLAEFGEWQRRMSRLPHT